MSNDPMVMEKTRDFIRRSSGLENDVPAALQEVSSYEHLVNLAIHFLDAHDEFLKVQSPANSISMKDGSDQLRAALKAPHLKKADL